MNKTAVKITFLVAIATVLASAIFGFSVMGEPGHMMAGCFGSAPGATCSMLSPIEHFAAHLNTFQSISVAVVQVSSLLIALLLLALGSISIAAKQINDLQGDYAKTRRDDFVSPRHFQFTHWLALHEKRDPSLAYAVNS